MSEKRFILKRSNAISSNYCLGERVYDTVLKKELYNLEIVDLLNELKEERNYFERKKCEYFNKYNKKHLDNIQLKEENEQLKERNEKLQWELNKTREDLSYFVNSKITATRGSDCGHDRCYVTGMQKKR